MKLSRVDRIQRTFAVASLFPDLTATSVTSVQFALLPPRTESPVAGTVWSSGYTAASGNVTVMLAGPDASSTGALVVTATSDLWALASDGTETQAAKIADRITLEGAGALAALPVPFVTSVVGATGAVTGTQIAADPALRAAYGRGVVTPEQYGAPTAYSGTADDTTAVQAAIDAATAAGMGVFLQRNYRVPNGGLTASGPLFMAGIGGKIDATGHAPSAIIVNSATAVPLTCQGQGNVLRDFAVTNQAATPTAGAGIVAADTAANQSTLQGLTISNFYDGVKLGGVYWTMDDCRIYDPVRYGLWMTTSNSDYYDHGDMAVTNNTITAFRVAGRNGASAVRWEAGGGLRFAGNKINGGGQPGSSYVAGGYFDRGLDLAIPDGVTTVDLIAGGNSIENCTVTCLSVALVGTTYSGAFFSNIVINDNEFGFGNGSACIGIDINGQQFGHMRTATIAGNVFTNLATSIRLQHVVGISIGVNVHETCATGIALVGTECVAVTVATQNYRDPGNIITNDTPSRNDVRNLYSRDTIDSNINATTAVELWEFDVPQYGSGTVDVAVTGSVVGVGSTLKRITRDYTRDGGAVTLTTVGTDRFTGVSDMLVTFDTATAGTVKVKLQLPAGSGGSGLHGQCIVNFLGDVSRLHLV